MSTAAPAAQAAPTPDAAAVAAAAAADGTEPQEVGKAMGKPAVFPAQVRRVEHLMSQPPPLAIERSLSRLSIVDLACPAPYCRRLCSPQGFTEVVTERGIQLACATCDAKFLVCDNCSSLVWDHALPTSPISVFGRRSYETPVVMRRGANGLASANVAGRSARGLKQSEPAHAASPAAPEAPATGTSANSSGAKRQAAPWSEASSTARGEPLPSPRSIRGDSLGRRPSKRARLEPWQENSQRSSLSVDDSHNYHCRRCGFLVVTDRRLRDMMGLPCVRFLSAGAAARVQMMAGVGTDATGNFVRIARQRHQTAILESEKQKERWEKSRQPDCGPGGDPAHQKVAAGQGTDDVSTSSKTSRCTTPKGKAQDRSALSSARRAALHHYHWSSLQALRPGATSCREAAAARRVHLSSHFQVAGCLEPFHLEMLRGLERTRSQHKGIGGTAATTTTATAALAAARGSASPPQSMNVGRVLDLLGDYISVRPRIRALCGDVFSRRLASDEFGRFIARTKAGDPTALIATTLRFEELAAMTRLEKVRAPFHKLLGAVCRHLQHLYSVLLPSEHVAPVPAPAAAAQGTSVRGDDSNKENLTTAHAASRPMGVASDAAARAADESGAAPGASERGSAGPSAACVLECVRLWRICYHDLTMNLIVGAQIKGIPETPGGRAAAGAPFQDAEAPAGGSGKDGGSSGSRNGECAGGGAGSGSDTRVATE